MEAPANSVFGTGGGFSGVTRSSGRQEDLPSTVAFPQTSYASSAAASSGPGAHFSMGDCHYYLIGACSKGSNCLFRHSSAAKASGTVCRFWQNGFCKDDGKCAFRHPALGGRGHTRIGPPGRFGTGRGMGSGRGVFTGGRGSSRASTWDNLDRRAQRCVFFPQGKCTKGDSCPYSHAEPDATANGGVAPNTQPRETTPGHAPETSGPHAVSTAGEGYRTSQSGTVYDTTLSGNGLPQQRGTVGTIREDNGLCIGSPTSVGPDGATLVVGPDGLVSHKAAVRPVRTGHELGASPPTANPQMASKECDGMPATQEDHGRAPGTARVAVETANNSNISGLPRSSATAPIQRGVIALPDGGFITRKRAAELQLRETHVRQVRQKKATSQEKTREHRSASMERMRAAKGTNRCSILDRLGPAPPSQSRTPAVDQGKAPLRPVWVIPGKTSSDRETVGSTRMTQDGAQLADRSTRVSTHSQPTRENIETTREGSISRNRAGSPSRSCGKRDNKRLNASIAADHVENALHMAAPSALTTRDSSGTIRDTRRSGGSRKNISGARKQLGTSNTSIQSNVLNFTVPTLDEIKSRKAKLEPRITEPADMEERSGENRLSSNLKIRDAGLGTEKTTSGSYASMGAEVMASALLPSAEVALPLSKPPLDEADMDEFSKWL